MPSDTGVELHVTPSNSPRCDSAYRLSAAPGGGEVHGLWIEMQSSGESLMGQQSQKYVYAVHVDKEESLLMSVFSITADQHHNRTVNASIFLACL